MSTIPNKSKQCPTNVRIRAKASTHNIWKSSCEDYRQYLDSIITNIETADRNGNIRKVTRLTKIVAGNHTTSRMPSKNLSPTPITSTQQLLQSCNEFLSRKFASPDVDRERNLEQTVPQDDRFVSTYLFSVIRTMIPSQTLSSSSTKHSHT